MTARDDIARTNSRDRLRVDCMELHFSIDRAGAECCWRLSKVSGYRRGSGPIQH